MEISACLSLFLYVFFFVVLRGKWAKCFSIIIACLSVVVVVVVLSASSTYHFLLQRIFFFFFFPFFFDHERAAELGGDAVIVKLKASKATVFHIQRSYLPLRRPPPPHPPPPLSFYSQSAFVHFPFSFFFSKFVQRKTKYSFYY